MEKLLGWNLVMIRVDRSKVPPPADLFGPGSAGFDENVKVVGFYNDPANKEESFKYAAYKLATVKEAIEKLFHGKCAYCESKYSNVQPVDVEHFRPKGRVVVDDKPTKPGYYWLAASWENLLPSCIDCNRERKQLLEDGRKSLVGKKDKFPIADEKKRARRPGDERKEKPLLLDPCDKKDDPSKHFVFTDEGAIGVRYTGARARKATESIKVFGLQRIGLSQARRDRATLVLAQIERVNELNEELDEDPTDQRALKKLSRETLILQQYAEPTEVYSAMARQLIKKHLRIK